MLSISIRININIYIIIINIYIIIIIMTTLTIVMMIIIIITFILRDDLIIWTIHKKSISESMFPYAGQLVTWHGGTWCCSCPPRRISGTFLQKKLYLYLYFQLESQLDGNCDPEMTFYDVFHFYLQHLLL